MEKYSKELLMGKVPKDYREAGDTKNPETDHLNPLNYIAPLKRTETKQGLKTKIFWSKNHEYIALLVWKMKSPRRGTVRIVRPFDSEPVKTDTNYSNEYLGLKKYIKDFCDQSHIEVNFF